MSPTELEEFKNWQQPLPSRDPHGTPEEIRSNLKQLLPHSWRQEGNKLIGLTEVGELVQTIPTNYLLSGTDAKGLPTFTKL